MKIRLLMSVMFVLGFATASVQAENCSKQQCKAMQQKLKQDGNNKQLKNKMNACGCAQKAQGGTPRQQRKAARRQGTQNNSGY